MGCRVHSESLGSRTFAQGVIRGRWVHAGTPWRLSGSFGMVGFTRGSFGVVGFSQMRPSGRWVHSGRSSASWGL